MKDSRLIEYLKNHKSTIDDIAKEFKVTEIEIRNRINDLVKDNVNVRSVTSKKGKKQLYHIQVLPDNRNYYRISGKVKDTRTMSFAASSDYHFASIFHLPKTWHEAMKRTVDAGITRVYVAGDIIDGRDIYRGHLENLVTASVEGQTDLVAEAMSKYPELEFWGIAGNHDYSFTKKTGTKPLAILESKIDNFKNLGDLRADIEIEGIKIRLLHGGSGRTYARSYPSQTYLRDYFGGLEREEFKDIPHIMILGHYHTFYIGKDHGIYIIQPTSFQDGDNEYCVRRGLTGPNGLFHISIQYTNGKIDEFTSKFIQPNMNEKGKAFKNTTRNY